MGADSTFADLTGEVLEADLKQRRFQLWTGISKHVSVSFRESEEDDVTTALKKHKLIRVRVKGRGEVAPNGELLEITQIEELSLLPAGEGVVANPERPIEEIIRELAAEVPQEEWDRLPRDLTDNLDHYIYGTPKR